MTWKALPNGVRDWIAVVGFLAGAVGFAFALGAATSDTVAGHRDLPARMDSAESALNFQAQRLSVHDSAITRLQRVDTVAAQNRIMLEEIRCIMRAEVEGRNTAVCLQTYRERQ